MSDGVTAVAAAGRMEKGRREKGHKERGKTQTWQHHDGGVNWTQAERERTKEG